PTARDQELASRARRAADEAEAEVGVRVDVERVRAVHVALHARVDEEEDEPRNGEVDVPAEVQVAGRVGHLAVRERDAEHRGGTAHAPSPRVRERDLLVSVEVDRGQVRAENAIVADRAQLDVAGDLLGVAEIDAGVNLVEVEERATRYA